MVRGTGQVRSPWSPCPKGRSLVPQRCQPPRAGEGAVDRLRSQYSPAVGLLRARGRGCWRPRSGWAAGRCVGHGVGGCGAGSQWGGGCGGQAESSSDLRLRSWRWGQLMGTAAGTPVHVWEQARCPWSTVPEVQLAARRPPAHVTAGLAHCPALGPLGNRWQQNGTVWRGREETCTWSCCSSICQPAGIHPSIPQRCVQG